MKDHWTAVLLSADLKRKPLKVTLHGKHIAVFRSGQGISAVAERCLHRIAELSKGRVMNGEIECPYHGWRFDGAGHCTAIPGCLDELPRYRIQKFAALEQDGVIFVSTRTPDAKPYTHGFQSQKTLSAGCTAKPNQP